MDKQADKNSLILCIELVELDQRIAQIIQEHTQNIQKEAEFVAQKELVGTEIELGRKKALEAQRAVDLLELELKVLDGKVSKTVDKILVAKKEKEIDSLEVEKASLEAQKSSLEEQGMVLLGDLEKAKLSVAQAAAERPEKEQTQQTKIDELVKRQVHIQTLLEAYTKNREQLARQVPQEFLAQYETMKKQLSNPIVPIINGGCSGCFHGLSRSEIIKAEQGSFVTCQGCYRMLYIFKAIQDKEHDEERTV